MAGAGVAAGAGDDRGDVANEIGRVGLVEAGDLDVDVRRFVAERNGQHGVAVGDGRNEAGGIRHRDRFGELECRAAGDIDLRTGCQLGHHDDLGVAGRAIELNGGGFDDQILDRVAGRQLRLGIAEAGVFDGLVRSLAERLGYA